MGWSQDLFRALWRSLSREVKEHVGTDQFGNKYYCIPQYTNWRGQTIREKRIVEGANKKEVDYEIGDIPTEWEAWIRRTRKTPPTMENFLHFISICGNLAIHSRFSSNASFSMKPSLQSSTRSAMWVTDASFCCWNTSYSSLVLLRPSTYLTNKRGLLTDDSRYNKI
ncbi:PREDICTED: mimitin, mitochondrial isoform X2 [Cercocebus atys]|uniref:mimitin, mitochondrial isoform X2 n=1 Tax=Cercocebus atys TaxID=9531 RepID=UPI0005F47A82|nr:PREDICTED: mimitin, mitochondrial isoform X2 [Cercocebus atys]